MKYYEIDFQTSEEAYAFNESSMCIKGVRKPTIEEAEAFVYDDMKRMDKNYHVIGVWELSEREANDFYDLEYEDKWTVFGKEV